MNATVEETLKVSSILKKINPIRYKSNNSFSTMDDDYHGVFFLRNNSHVLKIISSGFQDEEWIHVSVSLPTRCPTWNEMCKVRDLFFDKEDVVFQFHPKSSDYVNIHPHCLHLWKPRKFEIQTPAKIKV